MTTEYTIKMAEDGTFTARLSHVHRQWLLFLSVNGGHSILNHDALTEDQVAHLQKLVDMGLCLRSSIVGREHSYDWTLTAMGSNLVDEIKRVDGKMVIG